MSDTPPYSEATLELAVTAINEWHDQWHGEPDPNRMAAVAVLDALAAAGRLLPEGAETNVEYAVRFISQGGSHVLGAERQQQAHALASSHSRLPRCRGEVLRLTQYVVEEVEASYPGRSAVPPEPKEGAGGQPSPA
jgi:hypothetical protein